MPTDPGRDTRTTPGTTPAGAGSCRSPFKGLFTSSHYGQSHAPRNGDRAVEGGRWPAGVPMDKNGPRY